MTCRHCLVKKVSRPRGLCWVCFREQRDHYEPVNKHGRRSPVARKSDSPLPAEPTSAPPKSEEKIAVLGGRAMRGEALFHPADAMGDPPSWGARDKCREMRERAMLHYHVPKGRLRRVRGGPVEETNRHDG